MGVALEGHGATGCHHAPRNAWVRRRSEGGPPPAEADRQETQVARRLLFAATGVIALATAGLGTVTAQAAAPSAAPAITTARVCAATPAKGHASCLALRRTDAAAKEFGRVMANAKPGTDPLAGTATYQKGLRPQDLQSAYALPSASAGSGKTVAIVDAYDSPHAFEDVNTYRVQFGIKELPACTATSGSPCFSKVNQRGGT